MSDSIIYFMMGIVIIAYYNITAYDITLFQALVSGSCPLRLHKYQKGLNKLLGAVRVVSMYVCLLFVIA